MHVKAVIFDIGGVVVASPIEGTFNYEKKHGLPHNYVNVSIVNRGEQGAFQRLERGEIPMDEFFRKFGEELSDPNNLPLYAKYLESRGKEVPPLPKKVEIDGKDLFLTMMEAATTPNELMVEAIRLLRAHGLKVIALTNNFVVPESMGGQVGTPSKQLPSLFDEYIESSIVGLRKPDPKFFQYALDRLGTKPSETVFLDDIGTNVKAARDMGIRTIKVNLGGTREALQKLEKIVNIPLLGAKSPL